MKRLTVIHYYLCLLLLLSSCEEMFYRTVDFSLEGEKEVLVLHGAYEVGSPLAVSLAHSVLANKAVSGNGNGTGVTDAEVLVRANSGEWHRLYNTNESEIYNMADSLASAPAPTIAFHPYDTLEMQIVHPDYPAATIRQVLPAMVNARILNSFPMQEGWIAVMIEIDPYHGNPDDLIGIGLESGTAMMVNKQDNSDTRTLDLEYIYTTATDFAHAQNLQSEGYYAGSKNEFLFLPASVLQDTLRLALFADGQRWNDNYYNQQKRENYTPAGVTDLSLEMRAYTCDSYLYEVFRRNVKEVHLPAPYGVPTANGNIVQEILDEIASALGGQEMIPPFTNVEGGLGCFRAYSSTIVRAAE